MRRHESRGQPRGQKLREQAAQARDWSERRMRDHPVQLGLGIVALGFLSASLVPSSSAERRVFRRAADSMRDLVDRLEPERRLGEALTRGGEAVREFAADQLLAGTRSSRRREMET